jgi:hypothetical protein
MPSLSAPHTLVARGVDGLLVGWLAVGVWVAVWLGGRLGVDSSFLDLSVVYWAGAVCTAAHFGLSYHLAYRGGARSVRERPVALAYGPLALIAVLCGTVAVSLAAGADSARTVTSWLIAGVYLLTSWHYVKQVYGVGRVGAAFAKLKLDTWDVRTLRYGLYPLWFLGAAQMLVRNGDSYLAGYHIGFAIFPAAVRDALRVLALASALPLLACFVRLARRSGRPVPSVMLAPYVAAFLWLGLPTNPVLTLLLLAPFHALQYLAIGHRAEMAVADESEIGPLWWLNIFAGAACGGLLLSRWAPQLLDARFAAHDGPRLFAAAFFVFLNVHHYLIDASIWRSKGELVKAVVRGRTASGPPPEGTTSPAADALPVST